MDRTGGQGTPQDFAKAVKNDEGLKATVGNHAECMKENGGVDKFMDKYSQQVKKWSQSSQQ